MGRILIAGVLAGLAMFAWESVAHMLLPFGEMGLSTLPDDEAVRQALAAQLGGAGGLYFFPNMTMDAQPSAGPWGLILYHPQMSFNYGVMAGWELLTELVQGLALALVISLSAAAAFGRRMTIALLVGIAAAVCVSPSYTIWFGYPLAYTLGQMIVALGDYLVGGALIAAMLGRRPAIEATA